MGQNGKQPLVAVIGPDRQFRYYVSSGRARILLREAAASIFARSPLSVLQLRWRAPDVDLRERYFFRCYDESVRVLDETGAFTTVFMAAKATDLLRTGRATLTTEEPPTIRLVRTGREGRRPKVKSYLDRNGDITNWTEFWGTERDIYVQNLHDSQISIQIRLPNGSYEYLSIPMLPDPINLTSMVSFEDLRASLDIRKAFNMKDRVSGRRYLRIMEEDEYLAHFEMKAKAQQITAAEAMRRSDEARRAYHESIQDGADPKPIHRVVEEGSGPQGATHFGERQRVASADGLVNEEDVIRDRVRILMFNIQQDVLDEQKRAATEGGMFNSDKIRSASAILTELQAIPNLTEDELEHIRAKAYWPSVKRWATTEVQKLHEVPSMAEMPVARDDGDDFIRRQAMVG